MQLSSLIHSCGGASPAAAAGAASSACCCGGCGGFFSSASAVSTAFGSRPSVVSTPGILRAIALCSSSCMAFAFHSSDGGATRISADKHSGIPVKLIK